MAGAMDPEVKVERIRRHHARMIGEAAATNDTGRAHGKLVEADEALDRERPTSKHSSLLDMFKAELAKLLQLKEWKPLLAALLASKRSHDTQRFASRGDVKIGLFEPRRIGEYVVQASKFEEDPSRPLPSVEDDFRAESPQDLGVVAEAWAWESRDDQRSRSSSGTGWWARPAVLCFAALVIAVILAAAVVLAVNPEA